MKRFRNLATRAGLTAMALFTVVPSMATAAVTYDFVATSAVSGLPYGSFEYTAPSFLSGIVNIPASALTSCSVVAATSCGVQLFDTLTYQAQGKNQIGFGSNLASTVYLFNGDAFNTLGTHVSLDPGYNQFASLTVTAVPEPEIYAMMRLGLA